jgi:[acyl-carrier-protein] S-malonyltransferase
VKIALLFPGQGSQHVGMGREVAEASKAARAAFDEADAALGEPLSELCFEGPEDALMLTANTQPALVATSGALLAALRERVPSWPAVCAAAGHSLGEYSALVAAGALGLADAVRLVRVRGRAMQEAVPPGQGAMAALMGLEPAAVEALCAEAAGAEVVLPANFNGTQIVIAGHAGAVGRAIELAQARKGKAILLKVSAPFHCPLMAPAVAALEAPLAAVAVRPLAFPVFANVDARPNADPEGVRPRLLRQIDHPVRWEETVRALAAAGVTHAVEVGPGKVLAGLVKRIEKSIQVLPCSDLATLEAAAELLRSAALRFTRARRRGRPVGSKSVSTTMFDLSGKVALVTGGSRGIGRATCEALARQGAHVVVNYARGEAQAAEVVAGIVARGGKAEALGFDVADTPKTDAAIADLAKRLGRLDVLVANAGISIDGLALQLSDETLERLWGVNVRGALASARSALRPMIRARRGRIIFVSSVVGEMGNAGQTAYATTKAALLGATKSLAREYAKRNVTVNAVTPGWVDTEMTRALPEAAKAGIAALPLGRAATPEEVAAPIVFLASDEASYVTGAVLRVNGGLLT